MAKGGGGINIVLSADAEALKKGLAEAKAALSKTADAAVADQKRLADAATRFTQQAANAGTLKQQGRALQNLAYSYQQMGEAGKKSLKETLIAARENKDAQEDLQMAIQAGTIEGKFQMAARAIGEVTQVLAGVKGAMMAMGMSTEDAQESIAKLQGMMAFSQGMAALIGLDGAVKALIPSIGAATAGLTGFKAALASTGIGLAAVAIGYLAMELADMAFGEDEATKAAKAHDEARKKLAETYRELDSYVQNYFETSQLMAQAEGATDKELAKNKLQYLENVYKAEQARDKDSITAKTALLAYEAEKARQQIKLNEDAEKAAKDSIARQLAKSKEAFEIEILQLKARGASASELADAEEAFKVRDLSLARSIGAEKDAIRQREVDLEKFKLQRIIDETAWAQEQIKRIAEEGPIQGAPKSAKMAEMLGAMNEAQWTNLMRTNRKFFEQMMSEDIRNFRQYIDNFYKEYDAAQKSFDPKNFTDAMMPPDAPEKINIGYKKIMGVDNANHNARVRQQTAQINAMNQGLQQGLGQGLDAFEQFVSGMVMKDENAGKNFGRALLGAVAGFMSTLGKAMVAAGLASETFQKALLTNPALAIGSGAALVIAAGIVKGKMAKAMGANDGGGGNTGAGPEGIRRFASGGIISGPTIGMMGEYPGAKSNPEVVAPLDKLKNIIGTSGSQGGELVTRISGQDLLIMLDRAETYRGRVR